MYLYPDFDPNAFFVRDLGVVLLNGAGIGTPADGRPTRLAEAERQDDLHGGINSNCAGTGGVYRVDRAWNLSWLYVTFGQYLP